MLRGGISLCFVSMLLVACVNVQESYEDGPKPSGKDYYRTLADGELALYKVTDPREMPSFDDALADLEGLAEAVQRSLNYLSKASSEQFFPAAGISHQRMVESLKAFRAIIVSRTTKERMAEQLKERFDVYSSVGFDRKGTVLFTGYYTPVFKASRTKSARFSYPLYALPKNHVKDPITGETKGLRRADGSIDPNYPDRAALVSSGMLDGLELVYLEDAVKAYVVEVQGSAILELEDGSRMEVGYAGTNGAPYSSISQSLVKHGKLRRDQLSLDNVMAYFYANPEDFKVAVNENKRFIFFQESGGGPFGSLNEKVTRLRSIATDKSIFPRGGITLVNARLPIGAKAGRDVSRFMCDHDTGGAIRAPGRCDIFWGVDEPSAYSPKNEAGNTYTEGRLFYLVLKE
ncbi:MAG: MltA domain-containing protein [Planctomycetes bacterium]|nr:MltA domain-containing protein [Planctomycetota bacterium]